MLNSMDDQKRRYVSYLGGGGGGKDGTCDHGFVQKAAERVKYLLQVDVGRKSDKKYHNKKKMFF